MFRGSVVLPARAFGPAIAQHAGASSTMRDSMHRRHRPELRWGATRPWLASAALALAFACTATPELPHIPPVTPAASGLVLPGKFVWFDLVAQDAERSKTFYAALFGWTYEANGRYHTILRDGVPIGGIVEALDPEQGSEWVGNLSVGDVDSAVEIVKRRGGVVEREAVEAPDRGRIAIVSSEGAILLLTRASGGDPPDADPALHGWLWAELWTHEPEAAIALYTEIAGYEGELVDFRDGDYQILKSQGQPRAGVVPAPPDVNPLWLPYLRVEDAEATATRAAALGARVVYTDENTAILVDPTGAEIGVGEWQKQNIPESGAPE
jgi:predicted enzyme related to lactoylglutathione lyase